MKTTAKIFTAIVLMAVPCIFANAIVLDENFLNNRSAGMTTPARSQSPIMVRAVASHDGFIPTVSLPQVEISAGKLIPNLYPTTLRNGCRMAVVELPEVTVSASYNRGTLHPIKRQAGDYIVMASLPEVEIQDIKADRQPTAEAGESGRSYFTLPYTLPLVGVMLFALLFG